MFQLRGLDDGDVETIEWEISTYVALESALEDQLFGHCNGDEVMQRIKVRGEKGKKSRLLCKT